LCGQDARTTRVLLLISVLNKIGNCCKLRKTQAKRGCRKRTNYVTKSALVEVRFSVNTAKIIPTIANPAVG
jgi:hypothetical protein